jgi:hypothetical protein
MDDSARQGTTELLAAVRDNSLLAALTQPVVTPSRVAPGPPGRRVIL